MHTYTHAHIHTYTHERRYFDAGELENYDRKTTAGLSVACLRAGDESTALEVFESALKPAPGSPASVAAAADTTGDDTAASSSSASASQAEAIDESDEEEDDWEAMEASEAMEEILDAEGEVLPELLGYYVDRVQKEKSQEAVMGVSRRCSALLCCTLSRVKWAGRCCRGFGRTA